MSSSLQAVAQDHIQQIEHSVATQGTHDAVDLLKMFDHSPSEAIRMASTFGRFLKAACVPTNYVPNKHKVQFGALPSSCNDVALYNPTLHADVIMPAYESFKQSQTYTKHVEEDAGQRRLLRRRHMEIADIAETHSRPTQPLANHMLQR